MAWARVVRGMASVAKAVTCFAASGGTTPRLRSGIREQTTMAPGLSQDTLSGCRRGWADSP